MTLRMFALQTFKPIVTSRRAFSLIELMVVVGIIVLLVGLTVGVSTILNQKSESRQVELTMELLDKALTEWEVTAERSISYGTDGIPTGAVYAIQEVPVTDGHELTHLIIEVLNKNEAAKAMLSAIDPRFLKLEDGTELTLFDPWDNDFVAIFPGRLWVQAVDGSSPRDADGTIITPFEEVFGSCVNKRICFVSAGPDGEFGDISAAVTTDDYKYSQDNIYSYPLVKP